MKKIIILIFISSNILAQNSDWLINITEAKAKIIAKDNQIVLANGLLQRTFVNSPNLACVDFKNLSNNQQLLRAIKPEARIKIDGKNYNIGGLKGQKENAYIQTEWLNNLKVGDSDFVYKKYEISEIPERINWKSNTWPKEISKPSGKMLTLIFEPQVSSLKGLEVSVFYELYDNIPLVVKSLRIKNSSNKSFRIDRVVNEILGLVEEESAVVGSPEEMKKQHGIYIETNYAFNNAMRYDISDQTTHWKIDSTYTSQVNYNYQTPCLLEIYPEKAPGIDLVSGEIFNSVRTHELLMDSYDRQRRGLMIKRMYKTVAPWTVQDRKSVV